jgi:hypothetical protein
MSKHIVKRAITKTFKRIQTNIHMDIILPFVPTHSIILNSVLSSIDQIFRHRESIVILQDIEELK